MILIFTLMDHTIRETSLVANEHIADAASNLSKMYKNNLLLMGDLESITLGAYELQSKNCHNFQSLSTGEYKAYAKLLDKKYCDSCGIKAWGKNSNG